MLYAPFRFQYDILCALICFGEQKILRLEELSQTVIAKLTESVKQNQSEMTGYKKTVKPKLTRL